MDNSGVYSEIFNDYKRDKKAAEDRAEQLKNKLYSQNPRLGGIDAEISRLSTELFKKSMQGDKNAPEQFREKSNKLSAERQNILRGMGIASGRIEPEYKCRLCNDTGMIDTKKCSCFNRRLAEKYYRLSNLGNILKRENFEKFNYDIFSREPFKSGISPYDNIRHISAEVHRAIDNFENEPMNMLFYGRSGLGKSYMCNCIAKELMDRGSFVMYMSAYDLFQLMTNIRFNNGSDADMESMRLIRECDLLIIDDLGTEGANSATNVEFFDILNMRLRADKSTLISANLNITDIGTVYSERILSRILGCFRAYEFIGRDLRIFQ